MIPPVALLQLAIVDPNHARRIVNAEQRIAQLRAVTADLTEADAWHWMTIVAGLGRASLVSNDDLYRMFIRHVSGGATLPAAAAAVAAAIGHQI